MSTTTDNPPSLETEGNITLDQLRHLIGDDESPKYSTNLRAWLRKEARRRRGGPNPEWTICVFLNPVTGTLYIGFRHDREVMGCPLPSVLTKGKQADSGCWMRSANWPVIADFWDRYVAEGICYLDANHSGYPERWETNPAGDLRTCRWCGRREALVHRQVVKTYSAWEHLKPDPATTTA